MSTTTVSESRTSDSETSGAQQALQEMLGEVGVQIDGDRPWDPQVHDERLYRRVLAGGSLAAGEAYMEGWWDCEALDQLFYRLLRGRLDEKIGWSWRQLWNVVKAFVLNLQSPSRAYEVGEEHYDRGNDLFRRMLDDRMVYSCGYLWQIVLSPEGSTAGT